MGSFLGNRIGWRCSNSRFELVRRPPTRIIPFDTKGLSFVNSREPEVISLNRSEKCFLWTSITSLTSAESKSVSSITDLKGKALTSLRTNTIHLSNFIHEENLLDNSRSSNV
uniref:Uncharacterized protein n=1 Tax=Cacopsylla melanoneura TaxID=428564 RepID=A0A8D8QPX3_9HEMI